MEPIPGGTITTPRGFLAGATAAGIKSEGKLDLGILFSEALWDVAGTFTTNQVKAPCVLMNQERIGRGRVKALVVNSGNANAVNGERGWKDTLEMGAMTAKKLGVSEEEVLVASTGIIGVPLPLDKIREGIARIELSPEGGPILAQAIMTTDTFPKERAVALKMGSFSGTIGGIAKGAGMIHPNMATMFAFLTTDLAIEPRFLRKALREAVDDSFNMITVDGDTSTNDMVLLFANSLAGNPPVEESSKEAPAFKEALGEICTSLAKDIVRGGEGATHLITVLVERARSSEEARMAARAVAGSVLVKTAVYGKDPNWGRIVAALGYSGAQVVETKLDLFLGNICILRQGQLQPFDTDQAVQLLKAPDVFIRADLNLGEGQATAWGCDMTEEYVVINSAYTT